MRLRAAARQLSQLPSAVILPIVCRWTIPGWGKVRQPMRSENIRLFLVSNLAVLRPRDSALIRLPKAA